ncbi:hypothetical protein R69746_08235 [Paraburkholderia aspalathi]|uniref:FadR/GntR family transcriptional regulator n=1 Tax=Paraburkholderia aspalathi TaxID=1324617 RepID=UPI00190CEBD8|nr:FCD domain-containing protein [Paraburkholderia aspalathi]MBK3844153.1 FadR family transcriptional regulator [Paraburkholderia aspalathi]CAE6868149.1 hypothetical protein R69746_08235 [Paraburkholderia aspalathi]
MKKSLVERATEQLIDGIVMDEYPGDVLPAQEILCKQFGISRSVLREAVSALSKRGILHILPKIGMRVTPVCNWKMIDGDVINWRLLTRRSNGGFSRDLAEFRMWIEPKAAAQAALHASMKDRISIWSAYNLLLRAGDREAYMAADIALHSAIMMSSSNQLLQQMVEVVRAERLAAHLSGQVSMARSGAELETLARLMEAIDTRDATGATATMVELLGFDEQIEEQLDPAPAEGSLSQSTRPPRRKT